MIRNVTIRYKNKTILLIDNSAENFVGKLKSDDLEVTKKRDSFIKQSKESIQVIKCDGISKIL